MLQQKAMDEALQRLKLLAQRQQELAAQRQQDKLSSSAGKKSNCAAKLNNFGNRCSNWRKTHRGSPSSASSQSRRRAELIVERFPGRDPGRPRRIAIGSQGQQTPKISGRP